MLVTVPLPTTVTFALAEKELFVLLATLTVTAPDGCVAGAVYLPLESTVPTVLFPPEVPLTDQTTSPVICVLNCCVEPVSRSAVVGEMLAVPGFEGGLLFGGVELELLEQQVKAQENTTAIKNLTFFVII